MLKRNRKFYIDKMSLMMSVLSDKINKNNSNKKLRQEAFDIYKAEYEFLIIEKNKLTKEHKLFLDKLVLQADKTEIKLLRGKPRRIIFTR